MPQDTKWKTKGIILKGLNDQYIRLKEDYPLEKIRQMIEENFILICRKCSGEDTCQLYSEKIRDEPCLLMRRILENFIQTTSRFVYSENQWQVERYIKSMIALIYFFKLNEEWKAELTTTSGNRYWRGVHTRLHHANSMYALTYLHEFIQNFDFIDKNIEKKYLIFVEGESVQETLPEITSKLQLSFGLGSEIISLGSKDNFSVDKLRILLKKLKERKNDFFIILDGADENTQKYGDDLVREGLIQKDHFILWEKEFEDAFLPERIYAALEETYGDLPFTLQQLEGELKLKKGNRIVKCIEKLSYDAGSKINYDDVKMKVARKASELLSELDDCELTRKLKEINNIIENEKNNYYFLDPKEALNNT